MRRSGSALTAWLAVLCVVSVPFGSATDVGMPTGCKVNGAPKNTLSDGNPGGTMKVQGTIDRWDVKPDGIKTVRPDIFKPGYFSAFDVLLAACKANEVEIRYHFDEAMKTHVIDTIAGKTSWWYGIGYHGAGRPEIPAHRMDTLPYKDGLRLVVFQDTTERIAQFYAAFLAEVERSKRNGGKIIIPEVRVRTKGRGVKRFENVPVRAFNLRSDMYQHGVVTALDIPLSIAEQGKTTADVTWVDKIGRATVESYYVTRIGEDTQEGMAGFYYNLGENAIAGIRIRGFGNNRVHINADLRVLCSPEYAEWRWIDLGRGRER